MHPALIQRYRRFKDALLILVLSTFLWYLLSRNFRYVLSDENQDKPHGDQDTSILPSTDVRLGSRVCRSITLEEKEKIALEIEAYEKSSKFEAKIQEAKGEKTPGPTHLAVQKYLEENILEPGWSILELGCAAGGMLRLVQQSYSTHIGNYKRITGVELVHGWVERATEYMSDVRIFQGDVTDFNLPTDLRDWDFIMLNDVMEHIQIPRYACLFEKLRQYTHAGSLVYMHTPMPFAQLFETDQFYENVLPHDFVVSHMAAFGFELLRFDIDIDTECGGSPARNLPKHLRKAKCFVAGWPKYYHALFVRSVDERVLSLS